MTCSPSMSRSSSRPPASCELYDPATGKVERDRLDEYWAAGPQRDLALRRRVLVAGGVGAGDPGNLASAELYQPQGSGAHTERAISLGYGGIRG